MTNIVRVEWVDPAGCKSVWVDRETAGALTPMRCVTVGTIVKRTARLLVIAGTVGEGDQVSDLTAIPRGCVRSIRRVR